MSIRASTPHDVAQLTSLYQSAFPAHESAEVSQLAIAFAKMENTSDVVSLVDEGDAGLKGHIVFSKVQCDKPAVSAFILAPLAVHPDHQRQGVGTALIQAGISLLQFAAVQYILVYGDPQYYGKHDFIQDQQKLFQSPFDLSYPMGWQYRNISGGDDQVDPMTFTCMQPLNDPGLW